jgi:octaprenyl-diphosphate synthase
MTTRCAPRHPPTGFLEEALAPIQQDLIAVSERLLLQLSDPLSRRVAYLITAGGKRLRPALVLLSGRSGGGVPDQGALIDTATAVELIHTATLIHDDIIDQSQLRRRRPTFHRRWGTERAVLTGDYLYATAFTLLTRLHTPFVMRIMADVCQQLSRGELLEVEARYRVDLTEAEYLEIIRHKTASLIGGCCQAGAFLGGAGDEAVARMGEFGIHYGMAFQIIDDCLDLMGDPRTLGKSIHTDLDKGAVSLPIIYLADAVSARRRQQLFAPLKRGGAHPAILASIAAQARSSGAIVRAQERARDFVRLAREAIAQVPLNGLGDAYASLAEYAVDRRS